MNLKESADAENTKMPSVSMSIWNNEKEILHYRHHKKILKWADSWESLSQKRSFTAVKGQALKMCYLGQSPLINQDLLKFLPSKIRDPEFIPCSFKFPGCCCSESWLISWQQTCVSYAANELDPYSIEINEETPTDCNQA